MKTFLTALLIIVGLAVLIELAPIIAAPFAFGAAVLTGVGSVLFGGLAAVLGVLVATLVAVLCAVGVVLLVLSPIWIPVAVLALVFRRRAA